MSKGLEFAVEVNENDEMKLSTNLPQGDVPGFLRTLAEFLEENKPESVEDEEIPLPDEEPQVEEE